MTSNTNNPKQISILSVAEELIKSLDKDREKEIVNRRFGIYERKETLEQIGEILGITRERVRQLEKSIVIKLKEFASSGKVTALNNFEEKVQTILTREGGVVRVLKVTSELTENPTKIDQSIVSFLAQISSKLNYLPEDDFFYSAIFDKKFSLENDIKTTINKIVNFVQNEGVPVSSDTIATSSFIQKDPKFTQSLASCSKQLASLNGLWGLLKWPTVNPKNIRDKIYVILKANGKHMHFSEIAEQIRNSEFRRSNVTTQAIHNELIKDKRFVLIGRGIYALKEWGYSRGTVSDIIEEVLREAKTPLHKDEIIKKVLKSRFVKETTILLNLQGKSKFKRVAKATYDLAEN